MNIVERHSALLGKLALNVEDFYVKTIGWGYKKIMFLPMEHGKVGYFPCNRLKINDFLSSYNPNLKIDIFTTVQQIPCYCKSRLRTLRLILWWRVTFILPMATVPVYYIYASAECTTAVIHLHNEQKLMNYTQTLYLHRL